MYSFCCCRGVLLSLPLGLPVVGAQLLTAAQWPEGSPVLGKYDGCGESQWCGAVVV